MKSVVKNTTMLVALLAMTALSAGADEAKNDTPKAVMEKMFKAMAKSDADVIIGAIVMKAFLENLAAPGTE